MNVSSEKTMHEHIKDDWVNKLQHLGYKVETEKTLSKNDEKKMRVDVYAENDKEIICVEVIDTSWTGKNPNDYILSNKPVKFICEFVSNIKKIPLNMYSGIYREKVDNLEKENAILRAEINIKKDKEEENHIIETMNCVEFQRHEDIEIINNMIAFTSKLSYAVGTSDDDKLPNEIAMESVYMYSYYKSGIDAWKLIKKLYIELMMIKLELKTLTNETLPLIIKRNNTKQ